jgi:HEAT repeat protein
MVAPLAAPPPRTALRRGTGTGIARCPALGLCLGAVLLLLWPFPSSAQEGEFGEWIEGLRDPSVRVSTAYTPPDPGADLAGALGLLQSALRDRDPHVRAYGAAALGEWGTVLGAGSEGLQSLLSDPDPLVRAQAVVALGKLGRPAVAGLVARLAGEEGGGRGARLEASSSQCRTIGQPPALAAISLTLVGPAAGGDLLAIAPRLPENRRALLRFALSGMGPSVASLVREALEHGDAGVREVAAGTLADLGAGAEDGARSVEGLALALARLVRDPEPRVRVSAASALVQAARGAPPGERTQVAALLSGDLERERDSRIRRLILQAMGALGPDGAEAIPLVIPWATARDRQTAQVAIESLGAMGRGEPEVVRLLGGLLRDGPDALRGPASRSLGLQGAVGVSSLLLVVLDQRAQVAARAAGLDGLREAALADPETRRTLASDVHVFEPSLRDPSPDVRIAATHLLAVISPRAGVEVLLPEAEAEERARGPWATLVPGVDRRPDAERRGRTLEVLGEASAGDARALPVLREAIQDDDLRVRSGAIAGLARTGAAGRAAAPDLLSRLPTADPPEQRVLLDALGALSPLDTSSLPQLSAWLTDADPLRRVVAAELLRPMGSQARPAMDGLRSTMRAAVLEADRTLAYFAAEALVAADPETPPEAEVLTALFDGAVLEVVADAEERMSELWNCPRPAMLMYALSSLEPFPWPPPPPSQHDILPGHLYRGHLTTLGEAHAALDGAIRAAGFPQVPLYGAPGGFALVTQVERMDRNGSPLPPPDRFSPGKPTPRSLGEYLAQLFLGPPGEFRFISLAVTTQPNVEMTGSRFTEEDARALAAGGGRVLPPELAHLPMADREILVLVYHFERQPGGLPLVHRPGPIGWDRHLALAGVSLLGPSP